MFAVAEDIERGRDPMETLDDHFPEPKVTDPEHPGREDYLSNIQPREISKQDRDLLKDTVKTLKKLHRAGAGPYMGLLHAKRSEARRPGAWQGRRGGGQPAVVELQPDHRR